MVWCSWVVGEDSQNGVVVDPGFMIADSSLEGYCQSEGRQCDNDAVKKEDVDR